MHSAKSLTSFYWSCKDRRPRRRQHPKSKLWPCDPPGPRRHHPIFRKPFVQLINATHDLSQLCLRLANEPFITVDTEFHRETTFWPKVCLIQIASPSEAYAVDTLAGGLDLAPFFDLMRNKSVVKVFHAARQDLEIIWNLAKIIPEPLFDTQVAAAVCGYGEQVSYSELVQNICQVSIDKSSRFTDWARRPLSDAQLAYAIADVTHLIKVYQSLAAKLEKSGRMTWLADEMNVLTSPATYEQHPEDAWERFRNRARKPRDLAVLMDLAAWREREAQSRDVPRGRILKDDVLIEIALAAPKDIDALANLRAFPRGMERTATGTGILNAVTAGLARDPKSLPGISRDRRSGNGGATGELLKVLLRQVSEAHGVAAKMIATVDDLEAIAATDRADCPALHGWRHEIFGHKAIDLKHGRLALTVERGKVVTLEWQEGEPDSKN
ncbi:MAG: ribonuclease D [Hyphomicrobiales bacterium]|nr:ribonuclease D [Hyphomicrobiales bacterium]